MKKDLIYHGLIKRNEKTFPGINTELLDYGLDFCVYEDETSNLTYRLSKRYNPNKVVSLDILNIPAYPLTLHEIKKFSDVLMNEKGLADFFEEFLTKEIRSTNYLFDKTF